MWEAAAAYHTWTTHVIVGPRMINQQPHGTVTVPVSPFGTCFLLNSRNQFLTNAHVVREANGCNREKLKICMRVDPDVFLEDAQIVAVGTDVDLAVLEVQQVGKTRSVVFGGPELPSIGSAVATMGFPVPDTHVTSASTGEVRMGRRLSTGFVSNWAYDMAFPPHDPVRRTHTELNLLSYGGNSGAPVFNLTGAVIGVNRGSRLHGQQVSAYSYAIRNRDTFSFLHANGVEFTVMP
jgi:S1-C subfamily serine protease